MGVCVGIDPGLDGAIAVLGPGDLLTLYPTPTLNCTGGKRTYDFPQMRRILVGAQPALTVIERVGAMPGQGVTSMFNFGVGYGAWLGMLAALGFPHEAVTPQKWKAAVLGGTKKDKQAAIEFIQRRFPGESLMATKRSRVPHDGMAESACLALYARQLLNGS